VVILLVLSCTTSDAAEPDAPATLIGRTEAIRVAIQEHLADKFLSTRDDREEQKALVEYYSGSEARLLWVDENGLSSRGKSVIQEIEKADDYGLHSSDYALPDRGGLSSGNAKAADWLAAAAIKVSSAVLDYVRDARGGRIEPVRLSPNLDPTLTLPHPQEVIESIVLQSDPASYLRSFQPKHPQFEALRQKLIELRGGKLLKANKVIQIPQIPDGPLLRFGVEHEQVALLRKRLDLPPGQNENLFDEVVQQAVMHFQYQHGSYPDGIVGPGTRRLLNPTHPRDPDNALSVTTVLVNMERWRWLPEDLGSFYVTVNVPEFMLRVMAEGKPIFTARVVVGAPDTQTPIFSQEMQEIVFNPLCQTQSRQRRSRPISRKLEATRSSGVADGIPIFLKVTVFASISGATRSIPPSSIGAASTSVALTSINRRDPTMYSAMLNSCSPISTTCTCTTHRKSYSLTGACARKAMAAFERSSRTNWRLRC